jgi:hypothetical protein
MALARSEDNPKGFNNDIIPITGLNTSPTATDSGIVFAEKTTYDAPQIRSVIDAGELPLPPTKSTLLNRLRGAVRERRISLSSPVARTSQRAR